MKLFGYTVSINTQIIPNEAPPNLSQTLPVVSFPINESNINLNSFDD